MPRVVFPSLALVVLATASACSGAPPSELLAGTYGGQTTGGVDASTDGAGHGGQGGNDAGTQPDVTTVPDASGVADVVSVPETSVPEAGGGGGDVSCGNTSCPTPQQFCCVTGAGVGSTPSYKCESGQANCGGGTSQGTPVRCDKTADCPGGEVCCGTDYNGYYSEVSCQATCNGTGQGFMQVQFCDPNANDCPQGTTCQMSGVLTGYNVCR